MSGELHTRGSKGCIWHGVKRALWHKSNYEAREILKLPHPPIPTIPKKGRTKMTDNTTKVSAKLAKVNENFSVYQYDNGYMIEVGGRDKKDNWKTAKIMVSTVDQLIAVIKEVTSMERAD